MMTFNLVAVLALISTAFAERISVLPDVSWQRSPSVSSSGSGVVQESNVRPSSLSRDNSFSSSDSRNSFSSSDSRNSFSGNSGSAFGFERDSNSRGDSRFPITGGSTFNSGSSRGSVSSTGSRFPDSSGSRFPISGGSRVNSNTGSRVISSGFDATTQDPTRGNYVRIIGSLVRLNNSKSLTSTGSSCSTFGHCDPLVFADIDTERPNAAWPGARDTKVWPQIFSAKGQDNLDININNITKDSCGQTYREANLRVRIEDKKTLFSNAVINEFDCPINRAPQDSEFSATWSPIMECLPRFQPGKMTLTYRFKVFYVSRYLCGASSLSTTTPRSG